ncbi:MAG: hypothetical protein HY909_07550 [Deltaproteobacteria bacterium]|nr:hypothetical protein [Deltaproteobacteria bacterium]
MNHSATIRRLSVVALAAVAATSLGGCFVESRAGGAVTYPASYTTYGYSNAASTNTVYYNGGYHSGVYYRPGYYYRNAPFVVSTPTVYAPSTAVVTNPGVMVGTPGASVSVGTSVQTPVVGVGMGGGVRVGVPIP